MSQMKCPNCGAPMDILENKDYQFCQFCGTKVETKASNYADAAVRIRAKELEYEERREREEREDNHSKTMLAVKIFGIGFLILFLLGYLNEFLSKKL